MSERIGELQALQQGEEFRTALRALLMRPLMSAAHPAFAAVRRQSERLHEWLSRETGWALHVERDGARLYKRPAELGDATRGLPGFDRRRYVLLCLICAVLERADPQITLHLLGERVMALAADPALAARGFEFTLRTLLDRRDLVAVCRTLIALGVLQRVDGDEEAYLRAAEPGASAQGDVLYDIERRLLAGMLAAVRGPSSWPVGQAPVDFDQRLRSLVDEHVPDSEEGHRTALRHHLARRLLDDPVVYADALEPEARAYFVNQRGAMASRLCEATGLHAEQRAEGLALVDEEATLTDVALPAEGTDGHVALLVAELLAQRWRQDPAAAPLTPAAVAAFLRGATDRYGRFWRKSAREPGAEAELAQIAIERLQRLQLVALETDPATATALVRPLPAIARFALAGDESPATTSALF